MCPLIALLLILTAQSQPPAQDPARPLPAPNDNPIGWSATGQNGAVSAGGAEAVSAGMTILHQGGNAADAAVATILALGVTDAHLFCLGGEVPIIVHNADRKITEVIAGQGAAPALASRETLAPDGKIPTSGLAPAAVPAVIDACTTLLERHGTKRFAEVAAPTLALLDRNTFPWHADLSRTLRSLIAAESTADDRITGLRRVSDHFYRGPVAHAIDAWSRENNGLLRYTDLATHTTRVEDPVALDYHGHTILKCGPWTQGPVLLQTLQLLEPYHPSPDLIPDDVHLHVETLKLSLADRDKYYADPLYADVPLEALLDPDYANARRQLIEPYHASLELRPGNPLNNPTDDPDPTPHGEPNTPNDTTTCLVADRWGNVVAATPSGWSGVLAGDTGIWLGSRLQSFRTEPDHPNAIQPGKRPRITLTPTLVLHDGQPVIAISVAGGDHQDQVSLQILTNIIDRAYDAEKSVTAPRFATDHHIGSFAQTPPKLGSLTLDSLIPDDIANDLQARGHQITRSRGPIAAPSVLTIDPESRQIHAAGDPRARRHAAAR